MLDGFRQQREAFRSLAPETLLLQMYSLKVGLAFGLGAVILMGGDARFSGVSWDSPKDLVAWVGVSPRLLWGSLFVALGIALVWAIGRPIAVHVLRFGLVVYWFLVIGFVGSVFQNPTAALTGIVAYGVFGAAHLLLSAHLNAHGWQ